MRKLSVQTFVTLDGVMQAPGGPEEDTEGGFALGGWSVTYWDDQMNQRMGELTMEPLRDVEFSTAQAYKIRALIAERCRSLPAPVFVEMMRAAIKEDEWMLYAHGAIMGFVGGLIHLSIFGVG